MGVGASTSLEGAGVSATAGTTGASTGRVGSTGACVASAVGVGGRSCALTAAPWPNAGAAPEPATAASTTTIENNLLRFPIAPAGAYRADSPAKESKSQQSILRLMTHLQMSTLLQNHSSWQEPVKVKHVLRICHYGVGPIGG